MRSTLETFELVDTAAALADFAQATAALDWIAFDTEFVGEKRYQTLLCLIQVQCEAGIFLLDPLRLPHLDPFLALVENPAVKKITHAGDNDYRLLHSLYGTVPQNVFDTQLAAGFAGYRYPISFSKLVESELDIQLKKGYAVTDWESRPFNKKQLGYALDDVIPLPDLYHSLRTNLEEGGRLHWLTEECSATLENPDYYVRHPHHEALNSNLIKNLKTREQIFFIRLLAWRREQAERKDHSKEMIMPSKLIGQVVRAVRSGKDALRQNRRIPARTVDRYGDLFVRLYEEPATNEERDLLQQIPPDDYPEDDQSEMILELLYLLMKYRAQEEQVAHQLVVARSGIKRMRSDETQRDNLLQSVWRRELLGEDFVHWLENYDHLKLNISGGKVELRVER